MGKLEKYESTVELNVGSSTKTSDISYGEELISSVTPQDTTQVKKDSVQQRPTAEQIRYWRSLREKKMLIDGSRYIQPKDEVKLSTTIKSENRNLELNIIERNQANSDWITILFILILVLIASIRIAYSKYVGYLFQSLINYSTSYRMFREKNYTILHAAFRLEILFYLIFSIFIFQVIKSFQLFLRFENMLVFAITFVSVIAYFSIKKFIYLVVGLILEGTSETKEYLFNMDNFNRSLGLVLFPVVALINYYPASNPLFTVLVGVFIVFIFYIFLLQRGIYILMKKQFSIFYLFLYLCTLEFLPLLLIYKVAVE